MNAVAVAIIMLLTITVGCVVVVSVVYVRTMLKVVDFIDSLEDFIVDN